MGARHFVLLVATALSALALRATAQVDHPPAVEDLGAYAGPLPGTEPDGLSATLIRDRRSGSPLAGVTVRRYRESIDPRVAVAPFLGESRSDAFGLVSAPVEKVTDESHWIFELAGHAVRQSYGQRAGRIVELSPGRELHGRLFDPMGTPAHGVAVQLFLGCGHSPTVRRAQTDAQGCFALHDVAPRLGTLWISGPGLAARNVNDPTGSSHQPMVIHADPGVELMGRVIDRQGRPVPRVVVRSTQETRGPTAVTGPDGSFALSGFDPGECLRLCGPDGREIYVGRGIVDPARPPRLVYLAATEEDHEEAKCLPLRVRVVDAEGGGPVSDAIVKLSEPGRELIHCFDLGSGDEPEAPAGDYLLSVGDTCSSHVAGPRPITLEAGSDREIRIVAQRQPALVVTAAGFPTHRDAKLELVLPGESLLLPRGRDVTTWLPAEAVAMVRAVAHGLVRHFPVGPSVEGRRRVQIAWPAMKRIVVDFGDRYALWLRHRASLQTEGNLLETHATGRVVLVVADRVFGEQEIAVDVPELPGAEVRIPAAALRPAGKIQVALADGSPLAGVALQIDGGLEHLDDQGCLESWRVQAGAAVRIQREGYATLRRILTGSGSHVLRWGTARLELEVSGTDAFVTYLDGDLFSGIGGSLAVAGLDAGAHTVIVAAKGRQGRAFRVTLREGETRVVDVALPRHP